MKTLISISFLFAFLIQGLDAQNSPEVYKLNTKSWPTETIDLDNIIKEIRVVPLETKPDCLIGYIGHIVITPEMIVTVNTFPYQAHCFDLKGKFLRTLGAIGKGPGEYQSAGSVLFNKARQEILLYDFQKREINFYTPKGDFIRQSSLESGGMEIKLINKDNIAIHAGRMGMNQEKCELAVLNLTGEIQQVFFPFSTQIWADCCCGFANGIKPNSVLYHKAFDYRIYEVFEDRITTLLTLDFGNARLDSAKYMSKDEFFNAAKDKGKIQGYNLLNNTPEHLAANIQSENQQRGTWILDHHSKKHKFLPNSKNSIGNFKGMPVKAPMQTDGAWFITTILGLNWNEVISKLTESQKVTLRKEVPGFIEAEKVAIDENPVLVFYRFNNI
jgi:hypothetical protein